MEMDITNSSGMIQIEHTNSPIKPASALYHKIIGASVSEPLPSDVNVDFVCHGPAYGVRTARQRRMHLIFLHVAVYVTMVTLFRQSIDTSRMRCIVGRA